jgi:anaerobic selenocysteine-containing dehydrogenase
MPFSRRDVLFGLGGGLAGATLTPIPWKLLDDSAIWTQRRHALPVPARGPVSERAAVCTLCPAGCPVRVRFHGARPVAVAGNRAHPLGGGACAIGLTLHHLAYHPLRLAGPALRVGQGRAAVTLDAAVARVAQALAAAESRGERVAVLDRRPGRVASDAWRQLLAALPRGLYVTTPGEGETLATLAGGLVKPSALGLDLEHTRTLVSFGAPLLDGWGRPARMRAARRGLRVVQLDAWRSPSAALADEWVRVRPGSEGPMALALAHAVARERSLALEADVARVLDGFAPERVVSRTGVEPGRVVALARTLLQGAPAVAIGGGDPGGGPLSADAERAIALLNVVLGSVGALGGLVPRAPLPGTDREDAARASVRLADVAAGSVGVLVLDAADDGRALPWPVVARVLAKDAVVVSLLPFDGPLARQADVLVPAPAPLEGWDEALPTADAVAASWALSAALLTPPAGTTDTVAFVSRLAEALGRDAARATHEDRLRARAAAIRASGRGRFVARTDGGYADATPADDGACFDALAAGGCWIDGPREGGPSAQPTLRPTLPRAEALERWASPAIEGDGLALVAFAARGTAGTTPPSPLLTKLYQESDLRLPATAALVSPDVASRLGLVERQPVRVEGAAVAVRAELRTDPTLPPGRLVLAAGPDPQTLHAPRGEAPRGALPLATPQADGAWREARVRVREA